MFYYQRSVRLMGTKQTKQSKHSKENTPTFLLELPLEVEAGQAPALPPGSRPAVLQCGALGRTKAPAPDESRPGLGSGAGASTHATAGEAGRLLGLAPAVRLFRLCLSRLRQRAARLLVGRPPGCRPRPDAGDACVSRPQPRLRGSGPARALQEPWPRAREPGEQT